MLVLLLSACIENTVSAPDKVRPFDDPEDTAAPVDTAADTDEESDTDTDADTDTAADTDVDTAADTDVDTAADTDVDTAADTDVDTAPDTDVDTGGEPDTDTWSPGPIVLGGDCDGSGYPYTSWGDPSSVEPELHVVGMYESVGGSPGPAYVTVERGTEMILALTSYSRVDWEVELDAGSNVTEILVSSYDSPSTVTFVGATTTTVTSIGWVGACGYEYPDVSISGCETPDLETALETATVRTMSSFQGCYAGGTFTVE